MRKKSTTVWLSLLLVFGLVAAACGDDDDDTTTDDTEADGGDGGDAAAPGDCPVDVEGDVIVSGSSTVEPISVAVSEKIEDCGSGVLATVDGPGTGDGFQLFCSGETDISDASRPISEEEVATCEENGIDFVELKVGIDGIAVLANPANDVECLSFPDLYALVGPESEGVDRWNGAADLASELGSSTELPDLPLTVTAPGEESGTYDSFVEIVLEDLAEEREQEAASRPDYSAQADDSQIIAGIEGSDGGFGWVGFAFAENAGDGVRALPISEEPGGTCVEPTAETIASNEYPISRDLYIYVSTEAADGNEAVEAYVDYYLSDAGIAAVPEVGYVALTDDALAETRSVWEDRETGTRDGGA